MALPNPVVTPAVDHRCSLCQCLDLAVVGEDPTLGDDRVGVHLTVGFQEGWENLLQGRVKLALTGASVTMDLDRGTFQGVSTQLQGTTDWLVGTLVTEQPYGWEVRAAGSTLVGQISGALGQWSWGAEGATLALQVAIAPRDLHITETEGLWRHDITPNQHAVLERTIALALVHQRFTPYLSRGTFTVGDAPPPLVPHAVDGLGNGLDENQLGTTLEAAMAARDLTFLDLAALAGLDPLRDLAGGNLLAVDLSGLDLSGANLQRVNLRGATLADVDLSEGDLEGARLNGADLSGAYLGQSRLGQANLQRASLALANLTGVDLRGADLRGANLTQTNLSHARWEGARFGDNVGLTEAIRQHLEAGGALMES